MTTPPSAKRDGSPSWEDLPDDADHCQQCAAPLPDDYMWGYRRFCSNQCRNRWHYAQRPEDYRRFLGERSCLTCGTTFEAREPTSKYCCHPCYWKSKKGKPPPWLATAQSA